MNRTGQKTILLVEDEAILAMAEKSILEKYGYEVITVPSGEKAVAAAEAAPGIDLVLMDINLGSGMDGTAAAEKILESRELPLVFLSSHVEPEVVDKTETISSYGYIAKNSGETVLLASIKMAFRLFEAKMKEREKNRALAHSYDLLSYIIEHNPTSIAVLDKSMKYLYVSQRFLDDYKIEKRDVVGKEHYRVFPDIPEKWRLVHRKALAGEATRAEGDPFPRGDGSVDYVDWDCRPWFEADGSIGGIVLYTEVVTYRKRAEEAVRVSEELFRKAFMMSPDAININRMTDGMYVNTNDGFKHLTGYTEEDTRGKTSRDIDIWVDPDDRNRLVEGLKSRGTVYNLEAKFRKKDGSIKTGLMSASIIDLYGAPHILSITREIGEIKKIQEELSRREAVHRTMIANISDVIAVMDSSGIIRYKSPNLEKLFGWRPEDLVGREGWKTVHPDDMKRVRAVFLRLLEKDRAAEAVEYRYKCGDGSYRLVKLTAVNLTRDSHINGVLMNYHDITERKQAEEAMKRVLDKLRFHLENTPLAVVEFDKGYQIISWSKKAEFVFGWKAEEVLGRRIEEIRLVHEEDIEKVAVLSRDMLQAGKASNINMNRNYRKDGSVITCEWYNSVLKGETEDQFSVLSLVLDITERLGAEERILNLLHEKELILKEVHHRVKNNMNVVMSLLRMDAAGKENPEAKAVLADAAGRVQSMMVLYEKLYRSEEVGVVAVKDYLPALIREIVDIFPRKDSVRIETRIDDVVLCAKLLSPLGIIVNELVSNAMKYAFAGRADAVLTVTVAKRGSGVTLEFEDNGSGLPENVDPENSSGFGLQLVGMLVKQINGSLRLERRRGTKYVIEFNAVP